MKPETTTYITPVAASQALGISTIGVSDLAEAGVLRSIKRDGRLYVAREDLERVGSEQP